MGTFVIGARIALAAVFATAGVAKLMDIPGSRRSLAGFGVPLRALPIVAVLLPVAELAVAVALVPAGSARWGAVAGLLLLLAFCAGIARAIARGQTPDCHCFGQLQSAPVGRGTLARNAVLGAVALVIVVEGAGRSADAWALGASAAILALAGAALAQWRVARRLDRDLQDARAELASLPAGLPVGAKAPGFEVSVIDGPSLSLDALIARGRPVVLAFVAPDCGTCARLLPELGRWQEVLEDRLTVAVISTGTACDNREAMDEHAIREVLLQADSEVSKAYRVVAMPTAVVVSPQRRIASAPAEGVAAIEPLIRLTLRQGDGATRAG